MDSVSLSGVIDILAHTIRLIRQEEGQQRIRNIEELFWSVDAIKQLSSQHVTIPPGQTYTQYIWQNPTDSDEPG